MNKKIGKFKLWQLVGIGGVIGLYLYERNKSKSTTPKAEGAELAGTGGFPLGGGGGGEGPGLGGTGGGTPPVIPGEPGPSGPAGEPGPAAAPTPAQFSPDQAAALEGLIAARNEGLPSATMRPAPVSRSRFTQTNPVTKQKFMTVKEHGHTVHVYQNGHKVVVGGKKPIVKKPHVRRGNPNHSNKTHGGAVAPIHHGRPAEAKHPHSGGSSPAPAHHAPPRPKAKPAPRKRKR